MSNFAFQIVPLDLEPASGAAELRPLVGSDGQEEVPPWPVQTLPSHGQFINIDNAES